MPSTWFMLTLKSMHIRGSQACISLGILYMYINDSLLVNINPDEPSNGGILEVNVILESLLFYNPE